MSTSSESSDGNEVSKQELAELQERERHSMPVLCRITETFFGLCGHVVTRPLCCNPNRLVRNGVLQDRARCCDLSCATVREVTRVMDLEMCQWCRNYPNRPDTPSHRSDVGEAFLDEEMVDRRREEYRLGALNYYDVWNLEARQATYDEHHRVRARDRWERHRENERLVRQRIAERADRRAEASGGDRKYFIGLGYDEEPLFAPLSNENINTIRGDKECSICREGGELTVKTSDAVMLPCSHAFHKQCVRPWMTGQYIGIRNSTCPACRHQYSIVHSNLNWD